MKLSTEEREAFRNLMLSVQTASAGKLPRTIVRFMEEALAADTKIELVKRVDKKQLDAGRIAEIMIAAGNAVDHGSTEPVEEFLKRELF